jgi:hypothetical protein
MVQFLHRNGTLGAQNGIGSTEPDSSRTKWGTVGAQNGTVSAQKWYTRSAEWYREHRFG